MKLLKSGMLVLVVLAGVGDARASYYVAYSANPTVPVGANSPFTVYLDGVKNTSVYAGAMVMSQPDTKAYPNQPAMPQQFTTLCLDFNAVTKIGIPYTYQAPSTFAGQTGIDPAWGSIPTSVANERAAIQAAAWIYHNYASDITGTIVQQEEVQLAVWDALYDTAAGKKPVYGTKADGARFYVSAGLTSAMATTIQNILSSVPATVAPAYAGYLLKPSPESQNGGIAQEVFVPVPEPTTVMAGILVLVPCGVSTLHRLRRKVQERVSNTL